MRRNDHFVQIYKSDETLTDSVAGFMADGLWQSELTLVVATQAHRNALEEKLRARGVDLVSAVVAGQYIAVDAAETLDKFMVDGMPDKARFDAVVGGLVRRATRGGRVLRAFGEMVAILWQQGNAPAAIALEKLWNELSRERPFALFCAYPHSCFDTENGGMTLEHVCSTHTQVIPVEA